MSEDPFERLEQLLKAKPKEPKPKEAPQPTRKTRKAAEAEECASCGGKDHQHGRSCQCHLCLPNHQVLTLEERITGPLSVLR